MDKLEHDILLGVIGGGTVCGLLTWIVTYATLTGWSKGTCDSGWLELGGFVVGLVGMAFGVWTAFYFERRTKRMLQQQAAGTKVDAFFGFLGAIGRFAAWLGKRRGA
jgi:hypothetical protein